MRTIFADTIPDKTALMFIQMLATCYVLTAEKPKKFENHTLFRLCIKRTCS